MIRWLASLVLLLQLVSCSKVPIHPVNARFKLADATWFEEEQTLFLFYDVKAEQGLGDPSQIEVSWVTDDGRIPWTPVQDLVNVHRHVPVDCGEKRLCGSNSVWVELQPRQVQIRLRYHRDGELALDSTTAFNTVNTGDPHRARSMVVYGVFDESNEWVQWRGRHTFPTLRNEKVTELGLRRRVVVSNQRFGTPNGTVPNGNPYGYGINCPNSFEASNLPNLDFDTRAAFNALPLPVGALDASSVCAVATVEDALGPFQANALARKNPEVRPAFPILRSPVEDATPIPFFVGPCTRTINQKHEDMQRQRLQLGNLETTCSEGWSQQAWVDNLVVQFRNAVEAERPAGNDMVLTVAVHQDDPGVAAAVEDALAAIVPDERLRSSPRLAGAFVLDSTERGLKEPELSASTLWCPAELDLDEIPDASVRACAVAPDIPDFGLGPFSFGTLPILPTRDQYLDFIDDYSVAQAGEVKELTFLAPEFAVTADHVGLGPFGSTTFLNGEQISARPTDAFSFCLDEDQPNLFVFRSPLIGSGLITEYDCAYLGLPGDICELLAAGVAPLDFLPEWHSALGENSYDLGVFWEFPFLLRMEYKATLAGSVSAFGLSVPFGINAPGEQYLGTEIWTDDEFELDRLLTQCDRYCDHPTFGSAGVYHVTDPFRTTYANTCYDPLYPVPGDGGFPIDP